MSEIKRISASLSPTQIVHEAFNDSIHGQSLRSSERLLEAGVLVRIDVRRGQRGVFHTLEIL